MPKRDIIVRIGAVFDIHPFDRQALPRPQIPCPPIPGVKTVLATDFQSLQPAAPVQIAGALRDQPVKQCVIVFIFRQIGHSGARIDGNGFMPETAQGFQRLCLDQFARRGRDLEDVPMVAVEMIVTAGYGFLAGEPTAPGCRAARAIVMCAPEREEMLFQFQRDRVQHKRRCSSQQAAPVITTVIEARLINPVYAPGIRAEGGFFKLVRMQFVIPHERQAV